MHRSIKERPVIIAQCKGRLGRCTSQCRVRHVGRRRCFLPSAPCPIDRQCKIVRPVSQAAICSGQGVRRLVLKRGARQGGSPHTAAVVNTRPEWLAHDQPKSTQRWLARPGPSRPAECCVPYVAGERGDSNTGPRESVKRQLGSCFCISSRRLRNSSICCCNSWFPGIFSSSRFGPGNRNPG